MTHVYILKFPNNKIVGVYPSWKAADMAWAVYLKECDWDAQVVSTDKRKNSWDILLNDNSVIQIEKRVVQNDHFKNLTE